MIINGVLINKFKKIDQVELSLSEINVIAGGNSSGKSSILQSIHFSVCAAIASRQQNQKTFSSDFLMYNITPDFTLLRNGDPYKNINSEDNQSKIKFIGLTELEGAEFEYNIILSKGRNHGNIACDKSGDNAAMSTIITDDNNLFSIYVPGLAGISQKEELKSPALVRRGVASGDANLYLRNVIYYLDKEDKLDDLNELLVEIFPSISIYIEFDEDKDTYLTVWFYDEQLDKSFPIELSGTGLLQVLQLLAYIIYFKPKMLLLDEPDSHLHPDNQSVLAEALSLIVDRTETQILLSTHSKHIIDALYGEANFIWMKEGEVIAQGKNLDKLSLFMDLGALNDFDRVRAGHVDYIFLTEDRDKKFLKKLLVHNGFNLDKTAIYSYKTCTNIQGAIVSADLLKEISPHSQVVIHRDRDFMTAEEVTETKDKIIAGGAIPFISAGSDIESYFANIRHVAALSGRNDDFIREWFDEILTEYHVDIQGAFFTKREDIKNTLYRGRVNLCPRPLDLFGRNMPTSLDNVKGKFLLKKIRGAMQHKLGAQLDIAVFTEFLIVPELTNILENPDAPH